jgi:phenylacetate-CoA ligase
VGPGEPGEFICTSLLNPDMPLVRYRVGDRGRLASDATQCSCGRTLPIIDAIEGRTNDSLRTADGRTVFWLNPIFYGLPVRESQIEQESLTRTTVRVAPAAGFDRARHAKVITQRLRDRMGDVDVNLELLEEIPRTANGKLRAVISRVPSA